MADLKENVAAYLRARPEGAAAHEIAGDALNLKGARGEVAARVVSAALQGDPRFLYRSDGLWTMAPPKPETPLQDAAFVTIGCRMHTAAPGEEERLVGLAARKVRAGVSDGQLPEVSLRGGREGRRGLAEIARFCDGATPAAFRWSRLRRLAGRCARGAAVASPLDEGICLHRLGRRVFPSEPLPSLDALATALGLSYRSGRSPEEDAALQSEALLLLLRRHAENGAATVEEVRSDLYPDPLPVRFDSYAFDEAFLADLPQRPGVYVMRDGDGRVIYVGKSVNLRSRVGTYFSRRADRPEKTRRILERIWSVDVETVGSELEALLLEARLIRTCTPEFNTQVRVHPRETGLASVRDAVIVLPAAENDSVELFCLAEGAPIQQIRADQHLADWDEAESRLRGIYFACRGSETVLEEGDVADQEIARSWLDTRRDTVNFVDVGAEGSAEEALRVLQQYVKNCPQEDWEKVWRV